MTHQDSTHGAGDNVPKLFEVDRVLDALGRGELTAQKADDPIIALLSAARAEADRNIPAPPNVAEIYVENDQELIATPGSIAGAGQKKRLFRRGLSALAAGGVSATAMIIAGGVAAAIAVGGLGYAAYSNSQIRITEENQDVRAEEVEEGTSRIADVPATAGGSHRGATDTTKDNGRESSDAVKPGDGDKRPAPAHADEKPAEPTEATPEPQTNLENPAEFPRDGVAQEKVATEISETAGGATRHNAESVPAPLPAVPATELTPARTTTSPTATTNTKKPTTAKPKTTFSDTAPQTGTQGAIGS